MKRLLLLFVLVFPLLITACEREGKDNPTPEPTEKDKILVNYPWRMSTVTDLSGKDIPINQWNLQTRSIKDAMDIEFRANNVTVARDQNSKQVINGGTWALTEEGKILDIAISGFSGKFGVEELTNSKMRLKSTMPINGADQETIMVFQPVIQ